jgi:hypothetical protein
LLKAQDRQDLRELRKQLLEDALRHYQQFIEQRAGDPKQRAQLADAYSRVALITDEIGSREEALRNAERALDLAEQLRREEPRSPEACERLARVLNQNWSNPARWDVGRAPANGDDLVFPDNAVPLVGAAASFNDLTGLSLHSITIKGQGQLNVDYALGGKSFSLTSGGLIVVFGPGLNPRIANPITLTGPSPASLSVASGSSVTLSGAISGLGGLTATSPGRVTLSASNNYRRITAVVKGELVIASAGALGQTGAGNSTVVGPGARLWVSVGSGTVNESLNLSGQVSGIEGAL